MAVNEGFHLGKFGHTYLTRFQSLQAKRVGIVKVNILYAQKAYPRVLASHFLYEFARVYNL